MGNFCGAWGLRAANFRESAFPDLRRIKLAAPRPGGFSGLVGKNVTPGARVAHSVDLEEAEAVVVLLVEVNHLPTRVFGAAADTTGGVRLLGAGGGCAVALDFSCPQFVPLRCGPGFGVALTRGAICLSDSAIVHYRLVFAYISSKIIYKLANK